MTTKRITAVLAAAAVCAASGVTASAAGKYQLLTEPMSTVDGTEVTYKVYDADGRAKAPFISYKEDTGISGVFDITQKDLKKWRSSGEFTYTEVNVDNFDGAEYFGENKLDWGSTFPVFVISDEDNSKYFSYEYDGKGNLESIRTSDYWQGPTFDGWTVEIKFGDRSDTKTEDVISVYYNDGELHQKDITVEHDGKGFARYTSCSKGKYLGFYYYLNDIRLNEEWTEWEMYDCDVVLAGVTRDGELETIYTGTHNYFPNFSAGDNFFYFVTQNPPTDGCPHIYSTETGDLLKVYDAARADDKSKHIYLENYTADSLNGNKMIVSRSAEDGSMYYNLVELGSEPDPDRNGYTPCTLLSEVDAYTSMSTYDGERYLVKTLDGKWGFLNSEGDLVATYDDAGSFTGKYAPVVKDGKAYLVNRNFKCVSEKIDAEGVYTLDNGLYRVTIDGENYFMTYSKNDDSEADNDPQESEQTNDETADLPTDTDDGVSDAQDEQTESDPADTDTSADENTSSDTSADTSADDTSSGAKDESKANPDTGAAGAGIAIGLTVFAAGAVLLSRKRR